MPMPGAPTITAPRRTAGPAGVVQGGQSPAAAAVIPFTRASRKKSRLAGTYGPATMNTTVQALAPIQLPAAGYLRFIRLNVNIASAGNAATVAFQPDAPFNIIQNLQLLSANGDSLISLIDGFTLFCLNKYGAFGAGTMDPVADPGFTRVAGAGATGGSASFNIRIPVEVDSRDAFCALQNMAANQSFLLQMSLNSLAGVYSTPPTVAPTVTITAVMEYWSAPADSNGAGNPQAIAPPANGSVSLIQTQTPAIAPSTQQNIPLLNVGNTIRFALFILRTAAGARTEADWPNVSNIYVNNDPWYYKTRANWRNQMSTEYQLWAGLAAVPTVNSLDNGVFVLTDFMNDGAAGDGEINGASNRNLLLVTGSGTALNYEAVSWGAAASSLLIVENVIRPKDPASLYAPSLI